MRVVIAEDSALLREGMVRMLELAGIQVVATASDSEGLLAAVEEHQPDLAVVDVRMPPTQTDEGMRAALVVRERWPRVAVLVLSQYVEEQYATELLVGESSGLGYLLKDRVANFREFLEAVRRVAAGGTALDPEVVSQLLVRRRPDSLSRLSAREREVLTLMAEGKSNAGIALGLAISESAVAKHINGIFTKLDLPTTDTDHRRVLAVLKYLKA
ncbi:response regulator [Nonomuraea angiospora]|uniref:response regulator transcription factor n=1 Tax=Nonomuraea TaxID=83681 RepID=UPI0029A6CD6C|nr:response regulator transcription factor [Nonomuraea angiospora]MDX3100871.1 response regulator transcription factor [Nonomuraea angiospora]